MTGVTLCRHDRRLQECEECTPKVNGHNPHLTPGDCDLCGEWSGTLRDGVCAGCVEFYKLAK